MSAGDFFGPPGARGESTVHAREARRALRQALAAGRRGELDIAELYREAATRALEAHVASLRARL